MLSSLIKKAQHPARFEPTTSWLPCICSTTVLQLLPIRDVVKNNWFKQVDQVLRVDRNWHMRPFYFTFPVLFLLFYPLFIFCSLTSAVKMRSRLSSSSFSEVDKSLVYSCPSNFFQSCSFATTGGATQKVRMVQYRKIHLLPEEPWPIG